MGDFSLSGGVEVTGFISPTDTADTYPVTDTLYGIDGLRNVDNLTQLNEIPNDRRRGGMLVGVSGGTEYYKLNSPPWSGMVSDWSVFTLGGGFTGNTSGSCISDLYLTNLYGCSPITIGSDSGCTSGDTTLIVNGNTIFSCDINVMGSIYSGNTNLIDLFNSGGGGFTHYLGEDFGGGIVYHLWKDSLGAQHGLIVSKTEGNEVWQATGTLTGADRTEDGEYNTGLMTLSDAESYVTGLGAGWYLPSIDELSLLWHNRFHVNTVLRAGDLALLSTTAFYWSSTEYYTTDAYAFSFSVGRASYYNKNNTYSVRAVRAF